MESNDRKEYVNDDDSFSRYMLGKPKGYDGPVLLRLNDGEEILFDFHRIGDCNEYVEFSVRHDGTHLFIYQCFEYCLAKMLCDEAEKYIVGKITRTEEFDKDGKFATKEKPWLRSRTTYRIDYAKKDFEYEEHEQCK